jgi:UTP--glucose-1-phosphate uridylyltransferase
VTYDTGAKDGFIMANIAFALDRPDIRPAIEADLKALVAALK